MHDPGEGVGGRDSVFGFAAALNRAESVDGTVDESFDLLAARLDRPALTLDEFDATGDSLTVRAHSCSEDGDDAPVEPPPQSVGSRDETACRRRLFREEAREEPGEERGHRDRERHVRQGVLVAVVRGYDRDGDTDHE
jgi:hypothetical protein